MSNFTNRDEKPEMVIVWSFVAAVFWVCMAILVFMLTGCASLEYQAAPNFEGYQSAYKVNMSVNTAKDTGELKYMDRPKGYIPLSVMKSGDAGNCLDFAVLKCAMLSKEIDPKRLSIWAFKRYTGAGHAVCVVDGKYALDWRDAPINFTPASLGADMGDTQLREYNVIGVEWKSAQGVLTK